MALCFSITVESLKRFYEPESIHDPKMILYVGVMGLIVNLLGLCLFHEHGHSHGGGGHGHGHGHSHGGGGESKLATVGTNCGAFGALSGHTVDVRSQGQELTTNVTYTVLIDFRYRCDSILTLPGASTK